MFQPSLQTHVLEPTVMNTYYAKCFYDFAPHFTIFLAIRTDTYMVERAV